jgi:cellobiose transport system permease protein
VSTITQTGTTQKPISERNRSLQTGKWRKYLPMYLSIVPFYIVFLAFGIAPTFFSLFLAFQRWDGVGTMQFVGLNNFKFALTDPIFGTAILNTFEIWFMSTIPMLFLALILAFLINQRHRSKMLYQITYYLPVITSVVAITLVFGSLFNEQYGMLNIIITSLHLPAVLWLTDPWGMKWAISLMVIWRWTGYNALIYMAGLQSIPADFYEAARLDGAATWQIFRYITVPLLRPIILFTVITSTIGGLNLFTEPQVLLGTSGGVGNGGLTMSLYQYWQAFASNQFGFGAAVSWIMFFIVLAFSFANWRLVQYGNK